MLKGVRIGARTLWRSEACRVEAWSVDGGHWEWEPGHCHRGPTDVEDDRPPHPKMARAVSASGICGSIVTFHAVKC